MLKPQITGDEAPSGAVTLNVSVVQSPMAPPFVDITLAEAVPTEGPAIEKLKKSSLIRQMLEEHLQIVKIQGLELGLDESACWR